MKYKTLFRLLLKYLGVSMFIGGIGEFLYFIPMSIYLLVTTSSRPGMSSQSFPFLFGVLRPAFDLAAGYYLFFHGQWIIDKAIPSNRPYCPECGYELTNNPSPRCPECGTITPNITDALP